VPGIPGAPGIPGLPGIPDDDWDEEELELEELGIEGEDGWGMGVIGAHAASIRTRPAAPGCHTCPTASRTCLIMGTIYLPSNDPDTKGSIRR